VARGAAGVSMDDPNSLEKLLSFNGELTHSGISIPANGSVPYNYPDSEAGIQQAAAEMTQNPYPITEDGLASAKELYNVFCGICHGEKGDGLGYLVREDGGKYPAAPANLLLDAYVDMSNGQYYQAIMYGKNLMGAYKDKLSHEERWQVIHYIRTLQAKDRKLEYSEEANTLNNTATPGSLAMSLSDKYDQEMEARREAAMKNSSSHGHDSHGEDHGHDDHGHDNHGDDHGHDDHGHDSHGEDHGDGGHSHDGDDHGNHDGGH
jgi:mono/diheme cytochrome c family protein